MAPSASRSHAKRRTVSPPRRRRQSDRSVGKRAATAVSSATTSEDETGGQSSPVRPSDAHEIARLVAAAMKDLGTTVPTVVDKIHALAVMSVDDAGSSSAARILAKQLKILAQSDPSCVSDSLRRTLAEGLVVVMRLQSVGKSLTPR